jgi:hypothetical protein
VGVLIAVAVMTVGALLPFVQTPCGGCLATPTDTLQVSAGLATATDAWMVLAMLVLLAGAAALRLVAVRPGLTAVACLGISCLAVTVPFVEVTNNGSLLFPGATEANPMTIEAGFYVFLAGAAFAGLASLALVLATSPAARRQGATRLIA